MVGIVLTTQTKATLAGVCWKILWKIAMILPHFGTRKTITTTMIGTLVQSATRAYLKMSIA